MPMKMILHRMTLPSLTMTLPPLMIFQQMPYRTGSMHDNRVSYVPIAFHRGMTPSSKSDGGMGNGVWNVECNRVLCSRSNTLVFFLFVLRRTLEPNVPLQLLYAFPTSSVALAKAASPRFCLMLSFLLCHQLWYEGPFWEQT